jgi:hypothetical protein
MTSAMSVVDAIACLDELASASTATALAPAAVHEMLDQHGFGDGLPVGMLDRGVADAFVAASGRGGDDVVASIRPLRGSLTIRRLAACAALAGCRPLHMPLLAAMSSALEAPEANALGVLSTTSSAAFMTVVNGPARAELGFNGGPNCLGPGNRSNATVGRCLSLVTRMVGGAREGYADMATLGQPAKYGFCFAENEEASPWDPLHVERGLAGHQSAVTVIGVAGIVEAFEANSYEPADMVASLAPVLANASPVALNAARGLIGGGWQVVVISPEWAQAFAQSGMSKLDLQVALFREARLEDRTLRIANEAEDIVVVVAGGPGVKQNVVPGWAGGSAPVTRTF